jgi:hypothetical protein
MKRANKIASLLLAIENSRKNDRHEWVKKHNESLLTHMDSAPKGSGFDLGTVLDDDSTPEKLMFRTHFHHMDTHGYYDGWTDHVVTVRASLVFGINIKVSGKDRNNIKELIVQSFNQWLTEEVS